MREEERPMRQQRASEHEHKKIDRSGCNEDRVNEEKNDTAATSVNGKKNGTVVTSATQEEGSGCNEDQ